MSISCKHWSACGIKGGGCCAIGEQGGSPKLSYCNTKCEKREQMVPLRIVRKKVESKSKEKLDISIPLSEWPTWTAPVIALRTPEDQGVGDTLKRNIDKFPDLVVSLAKTVKSIARWLKGEKGCGCEGDRKRLNAMYSYSALAPADTRIRAAS